MGGVVGLVILYLGCHHVELCCVAGGQGPTLLARLLELFLEHSLCILRPRTRSLGQNKGRSWAGRNQAISYSVRIFFFLRLFICERNAVSSSGPHRRRCLTTKQMGRHARRTIRTSQGRNNTANRRRSGFVCFLLCFFMSIVFFFFVSFSPLFF